MYNSNFWEDLQNKILNTFSLNFDGTLCEIISEGDKYIVHYQDSFGTLCECTLSKESTWLKLFPYDTILTFISMFTLIREEDLEKVNFQLKSSGIQVKLEDVYYFISYNVVEERFTQKLDFDGKKLLNLIRIKEGDKMNPYVTINQNSLSGQVFECERSYVSPSATIRRNIIYEHKKSNIKYQALIKDLLGLDTKFNNRFYKKVDNKTITIYNYENDKFINFSSFIDGIERKFTTQENVEDEEIIYDYFISNNDEFIHWVNTLKTFNYEDYCLVNKVNNKFNLRDMVYFVTDEATIDKRIFNDLWDLMTKEQRMQYLEANVSKQNLIRKGTIVGMSCAIKDNNNEVTYNIFDTGLENTPAVKEDKVFETTEEAVHYLVEGFIEKNKKD